MTALADGTPKTDPALWQRLRYHAFILHNKRPLADTLRDETDLDNEQAARVVDEYRRFLYLVATAGQILAPSRLVDMAWHLHMEDKQAYAVDLCERTIGRQINHHEGRPAPFDDPAYAETLSVYRAEFGEEAYEKVWPTPDSKMRADVYGIAGIVFFAAGGFALTHSLPLLGLASFGLSIAAAIQYIRLMHWSHSAWSASGCGGASSDGGDGGGDGGGCGGD